MAEDVELGCRCGEVHGWARCLSPRTVNRAVCYCEDCQAFLHHLGRSELLDARGGSDLVQVAPSAVSFDRATRGPSHPVTTLAPGEREALRAKCGPRPVVVAAQGST